MSDPTYDREVIKADPVWEAAFIMSEMLNDNAPIGWGEYIEAARMVYNLGFIDGVTKMERRMENE